MNPEVTLPDVNVLLALAWPNHQHHATAHRWFQRTGKAAWATCALTQLAFVRLSSNPAYTPAPVSPQQAADLLAEYIAHEGHHFIDRMPPLTTTTFQHAIGHQQVNDAYLVRLAEEHRLTIATFDRRLAAHAPSPQHVQVVAGAK
jgi:toxin-antitoxin system PIN domain toxin